MKNGQTEIIAIVGPESTGKTTLCYQLCKELNCPLVKEYAREFLSAFRKPYSQSDVVTIAKNQFENENNALTKYQNAHLILFDTDALVTKIWFEFKYGKTNLEIEKILSQQTPRHYLLTYPDLKWEEDPLREHPNKLNELFNLYKLELEKRNLTYDIVTGQGSSRLKNALSAIDKLKMG